MYDPHETQQPRDSGDEMLDRNLRLIARRLTLPDESTPHVFKTINLSAGADGAARHSSGVSRMHRTRLYTWTSTAVAASIALAAFFYLPTRQSIVEAATILRSFRESLHHGLEVRMEKLSIEGIHVDGDVLIQFKQPITVQQIFGEKSDLEAHMSGVYADLRVHAAEDAAEADVAGLDVETKLAFSPQSKWVFLDLRSLPTKVVEEEPMAALVTNFLRGGLLLELDGVIGDKDIFGGDDDDDDDPDVTSVKRDVKVDVRSGGQPAAADKDEDDDSSTLARTRMNFDINVDDDADNSDEQFEQLLVSLLSGQADAAQLASLVQEIEQHAETVTVSEVEPGVHLLSMSGFKQDADDAHQAWIAKMTIEMRYREGAGVESLTCLHVGDEDGSVRIGFVDATPNLSRFDKQQLIDQGVRRLDVASLGRMIEGLSGSSSSGDKSDDK
ncbi:hypothetical protein RAS1_20270 [Phycisphaerae bacterium RAS1]|nr:hypothetical protein RAS1_20270 [Phycisphaerae bacterium RAS1]